MAGRPEPKELKINNPTGQPGDVCPEDGADLFGFDHLLQPLPAGAALGRRTGFPQVLDNLNPRIRPASDV